MSTLLKLLMLLVGVPASLFATLVSAQDPVGAGVLQRDVATKGSMDLTTVRIMQKEMANCAFRRNREKAITFLENSDANTVDYDTLGYEKKDFVRRFNLSACLGRAQGKYGNVQLSFQPLTFRVLLAEEAYLNANVGPLVIPAGGEEFLTSRNFVSLLEEKAARHFAGFSDCVVFRAPKQSDKLLRTEPNSAQERIVVQSLVAALSECVIEGDEMTLMPDNIRGYVADGLWARSHYGTKPALAVQEAAE